MIIDMENENDDDLSYTPEELSKLDPSAFNPVYEQDIAILSVTSRSQSKKRGSCEMDEHEDNLQHPRTSAPKGSVTKPSSSEMAVVL